MHAVVGRQCNRWAGVLGRGLKVESRPVAGIHDLQSLIGQTSCRRSNWRLFHCFGGAGSIHRMLFELRMGAISARVFGLVQSADFYLEVLREAVDLMPMGSGQSWFEVGSSRP